jgi:hypothetical protein
MIEAGPCDSSNVWLHGEFSVKVYTEVSNQTGWLNDVEPDLDSLVVWRNFLEVQSRTKPHDLSLPCVKLEAL